jgi:hypothetical protein
MKKDKKMVNLNKIKNTENTATVETSTKKIKSNKSKKEKAIDAKNVENVKKAITVEKDLDYIYPKDCIDLDSRKKFRTGIRAKVRALKGKIAKADKADKATLQAEGAAWMLKVKTLGHRVEF